MKRLLLSLLLAGSSFCISAQVRILGVDPGSNLVVLKNFGTSTVDVSLHWFCALFDYNQLINLTLVQGSTMLAPNATVSLTGLTLDQNASDLGYYETGNFSSSTAMLDFTQWGSGGNGRESVAVAKGIWGAGDFINGPAPYAYIGNGTQYGVQFWVSNTTGVSEQTGLDDIQVYPVPATELLNVDLGDAAVINARLLEPSGKLVRSVGLQQERLTRIPVGDLAPGLYLLSLTSPDAQRVLRVVVE